MVDLRDKMRTRSTLEKRYFKSSQADKAVSWKTMVCVMDSVTELSIQE